MSDDTHAPKPQKSLRNDARRLFGVNEDTGPKESPRDKKTGRFKKGQSGNPNGRPKKVHFSGASMEELFQSRAFQVAEQLYKLIEDPKTPAHVRSNAISTWLDRGLGKATQKVEVDNKVTHQTQQMDTSSMSLETLRELSKALSNSGSESPIIDANFEEQKAIASKPEDGDA